MKNFITLKWWLQENIPTVVIILFFLVIAVFITTQSTAIGESELVKGRIIHKTAMPGTKLIKISALIELESGKNINIQLPANIYLKSNQFVVVKKQKTLFS